MIDLRSLAALSPRARAAALQGVAADPALSAWVSASAGSGKTRVLIERVLRLLLAGVSPGRILCLTFTKAAAAEMANRLATRLGEWAVMAEGELAASLAALLRRPPEQAEIATARGLFLAVLEHPGGMRISTIHSFCQSLLEAFPLEAGLVPRFGVLEESEARALLAEAMEEVLASPAAAAPLARLAAETDHGRFSGLLATLAGTPGLAPLLASAGAEVLAARLAAALGLPRDAEEEAILAAHCATLDPAPLVRAGQLLCQSRNENDRERGRAVLEFAKAGAELRAARWEAWRGLLLTKEGAVRNWKYLATQQTPRQDEVKAILSAAARAVQEVEDRRAAARLLSATTALLALAAPALARYGARKRSRGRLDYDDLIARTRALLIDPGAAWVQYKLDGGIAHVLLDESQDSNAEQWEIVAALTAEFFAGEGAERPAGTAAGRPLARSVFAVGDPKQSIYRFQGADPHGFLREKERFAKRARAARLRFEEVPLDVSFRSTAPVLALVDAVFADPQVAAGVVPPGESLRHIPDREGMAGRVELWPPVGPLPTTAPPPWAPPEAPVAESTPAARLAAAVAARIKAMIGVEELPARGRRVRAGDILILLARRPPLMPLLIKALKDASVPVGGADRLALIEQIGVMDLLAFAEALLLPQDDLTLAALLKSPLVGLEEEELLALAHGRPASLFEALMAHRGGDSRLGRAADWFAGFLARVDVLSPYGLLAAVLHEGGPFSADSGRARLLARLGPDAADPLQEVLSLALAAERAEAPSLQGFLAGLKRAAVQVKREAEAAGDVVRVMTVHGAKGLQAPIVILPDTMANPPDPPRLPMLASPEGPVPVWMPRREGFAAAAAMAALAAERTAEAEEERRLLYVALTRAEDRLIVCGQHSTPAPPKGSWYEMIEAGFRRAGAREDAFDPAAFGATGAGFTGGTCLVLDCPQTAPPRREEEAPPAAAAPPLPEWLGRPPPDAPPVAPLAPSRLGEAEGPAASPLGPADPAGRRFRRGRLIHALLQRLPAWPEAEREAAGARFLAQAAKGLDAATARDVLAEALAVLRHPDLAAAFGPDSLAEAPIVGVVNGVSVVGRVDRLAVEEQRILLLDFKTNRPPPPTAEAVPPALLRQMAAYRALLRAAFPGREVAAALVWTYGPQVMPLSAALLDPLIPGA